MSIHGQESNLSYKIILLAESQKQTAGLALVCLGVKSRIAKLRSLQGLKVCVFG